MRARFTQGCLVALGLGASPAPALGQPLRALVWPEVPATPPRVVRELGTSPLFYRRPPQLALPYLRFGTGVHVRLNHPAVDVDAAFALDLLGGVAMRLGRGSRAGALAELGYSYAGFSEHLAHAGLGAVWGLIDPGNDPSHGAGPRVAFTVHALGGSVYGARTFGVRTAVIAGSRFAAVELAHQVLWEDIGAVHSLRLTLTTLAPFGEAP